MCSTWICLFWVICNKGLICFMTLAWLENRGLQQHECTATLWNVQVKVWVSTSPCSQASQRRCSFSVPYRVQLAGKAETFMICLRTHNIDFFLCLSTANISKVSCTIIGHFQVAFCLCVKISLVQNNSWNQTHFEWKVWHKGSFWNRVTL